MKKLCFLLLMSWLTMEATTQNAVYSNLKGLLAYEGDTVTSLKVERRTKDRIPVTGDVDHKISVGSDDFMYKYLRPRCYAVQANASLYINCKRLCYKEPHFGDWYVPALRIGDHIYSSAIPLGSVAADSGATMDVMFGDKSGGAIAASALISRRVYYEIDLETNKMGFVGKERMRELLEGYPDQKTVYLNENSKSARVIDKCLCLLKAEEKQRLLAVRFLLLF